MELILVSTCAFLLEDENFHFLKIHLYIYGLISNNVFGWFLVSSVFREMLVALLLHSAFFFF